ncbi:MAG: DUF5658 family protein [Planctomycetota bacterium]|nr:DUF5658 family protein [Planctomycetota bacterium]
MTNDDLLASDENRQRIDRRKRPTPIFSRYTFIGRRKGGRRGEESDNIYVDRYSGSEWFLVIGVLVLSVLDMVFTLIHLDAGGTEANPIMDWTLTAGGYPLFKAVKLITTVLGLSVLLVHVRFRRVKSLLKITFAIYAALFIFHLYIAFMRAGA